jgi:hypothetical protein
VLRAACYVLRATCLVRRAGCDVSPRCELRTAGPPKGEPTNPRTPRPCDSATRDFVPPIRRSADPRNWTGPGPLHRTARFCMASRLVPAAQGLLSVPGRLLSGLNGGSTPRTCRSRCGRNRAPRTWRARSCSRSRSTVPGSVRPSGGHLRPRSARGLSFEPRATCCVLRASSKSAACQVRRAGRAGRSTQHIARGTKHVAP